MQNQLFQNQLQNLQKKRDSQSSTSESAGDKYLVSEMVAITRLETILLHQLGPS